MATGHNETHHTDARHGHSKGKFILGGVFMITLTILAFVAVGTGALTGKTLMYALLAGAVVQILLQLWLFMHLNVGRIWYGGAFGLGLGLAIIIGYAVWYLPWIQ